MKRAAAALAPGVLGALVLLMPLVLLVGACRADGTSAGGAATLRPVTPMRFRRMRAMLDEALADAARGKTAPVRAAGGDLSAEGLALLRATLPEDIARTDVPRWTEARARFGEALKAWATAVEAGPDDALRAALRGLDDALRTWIDAYLGLEPETAV